MQQPECELIMRQKHIYCIGMAKRKVKSSSRLFATTLIPRTCKYCFNSRTFIRSKFGSVVKENHQNSSFPNSRRPFVYIFTRISLAFVHSSQDVREYETRLFKISFFTIKTIGAEFPWSPSYAPAEE